MLLGRRGSMSSSVVRVVLLERVGRGGSTMIDEDMSSYGDVMIRDNMYLEGRVTSVRV